MKDHTHRNKAIVLEVLTKSFTNRDYSAIEWWLSPDYIQHNPPFLPREQVSLLSWHSIPKAGTTSLL
jgi:hypothetical protein